MQNQHADIWKYNLALYPKYNDIMWVKKIAKNNMIDQDFTGQSTKETCLSNFILQFSNPDTSHIGLSSFPLPYAL